MNTFLNRLTGYGVFSILACALLAPCASAEEKLKVYVADFAGDTDVEQDLAKKITDEFEAALVASEIYTVLERRKYNEVREHVKDERGIADIEELPDAAIDSIKSIEADRVIVGQVTDDIDSGVAIITVTVQRFDTAKDKVIPITMKRGLIKDYESRQETIGQMIEKLSPKSLRRRPVLRNDFVFQLKGARRQGKAIYVDIDVTNDEDDRPLRIYAEFNNSTYTRIIDNRSVEYKASQVSMAGKRSNSSVSPILISNVPVRLTIEFDGVSSKTEKISRLAIHCYLDNRSFSVPFSEIPIELESD